MPSSSLLLVTIEFVDGTVFSGNGVLSRTYAKEIAQNSKRHGIDRVDVLCARPVNDDEYYSKFENNKGDVDGGENYGQWFTSGWIFGGDSGSNISEENNSHTSSSSASSIKPIYTSVPVPESKWKRLDINSAVNEFASSSEKFVRFRNNKSMSDASSSLVENELLRKHNQNAKNSNKHHDGSGTFNPLADIRHAFDEQRSRHFTTSSSSEASNNNPKNNSNRQTATTPVFSETMQKLKDKEKIRDVYDYVMFVDWHGYFAFATLTGTRRQNIPAKTRVAFMNFRIFANKILFPEDVLRVDLAKRMEFNYYKQYEMAAVEQSDVTTVLSETDKELLQELCDDERRKIVSSIREQQGRRLMLVAEKNDRNDANQQQQDNFYAEDDDEVDRQEKDAKRKEDEALLKDPKNIHVLMCPLQESFISAAAHHNHNNKKNQNCDKNEEKYETTTSSSNLSLLATNVRCLEDDREGITTTTTSSNAAGIPTEKTFLLTCCVRLDPTKNAEAFAHLVVDLARRNNSYSNNNDTVDNSSSSPFFSLVRSPRYPNARLIPFLCGASANAEYAKRVKDKIRNEPSKFSASEDDDDDDDHHQKQNLAKKRDNVNFIIRDDFVSPAELMKIFETSVLNVHPCLTDAYGMSVVESTAMGCLTLTHGISKPTTGENSEILLSSLEKKEAEESDEGRSVHDDAPAAHQVKTSFDDIVIFVSNIKKPSCIDLQHQRQQKQQQLNASINNNNNNDNSSLDQQQQVAEESFSSSAASSWETHVGACGLLKYDNGEIILADFTKSSSSSSSSTGSSSVPKDSTNDDQNKNNSKKKMQRAQISTTTCAEAIEPLLVSCLERCYEQHEYQIGLIADEEKQQREESSSSSSFGNNNSFSSSLVNNNKSRTLKSPTLLHASNNDFSIINVDGDGGFAPSRDERVQKLNKMVERGRNKALSYGPSEAIDLLMNILTKKKQ